MSRFSLLPIACIILLLYGSCDESFNPSAPFQPRMVVYCILITNSDTQYVRVYSTYLPPDNDATRNPDEVPVKDAQVTVAEEGGATFSFQPMTIPRVDTSRYSSGIDAYYAYPFRPERGKTYTLTVSSVAMGSVTAKATVPGHVTITPINVYVLSDPISASNDFGISVALAPETKGYLARIYLDYLYPPGDGTFRPKRFEIPLSREVVSCVWDIFRETYPRPTLRATPPSAPIYNGDTLIYRPEERVGYNRLALVHKLGYLYDREGSIQFRQAVFYAIQFDVPLWDYYAVANLFRDKRSVRIDEPDYTNIQNGIGVFGSMTVDSVIWHYLPTYIPHPPPGCQ